MHLWHVGAEPLRESVQIELCVHDSNLSAFGATTVELLVTDLLAKYNALHGLVNIEIEAKLGLNHLHENCLGDRFDYSFVLVVYAYLIKGVVQLATEHGNVGADLVEGLRSRLQSQPAPETEGTVITGKTENVVATVEPSLDLRDSQLALHLASKMAHRLPGKLRLTFAAGLGEDFQTDLLHLLYGRFVRQLSRRPITCSLRLNRLQAMLDSAPAERTLHFLFHELSYPGQLFQLFDA